VTDSILRAILLSAGSTLIGWPERRCNKAVASRRTPKALVDSFFSTFPVQSNLSNRAAESVFGGGKAVILA